MCGIAGLAPASDTDCSSLDTLAATLQHRGPDDRGCVLGSNSRFALVHTRLSIIDLSPLGHQPMSDPTRKTNIVFNGEIYNFREIRESLQRLGVSFNSNSDTEVILKAYGQWGEKSFDLFNGMFAFALLDDALGRLYLVRDYAGMKPLYYSVRNRVLYFGSEIKAFRSFDASWPENPDWQSLFLMFGHIPEPATTLDQVFMLRKGSFLSFDLDKRTFEIKTYANLNFSESSISKSEALALLRETFLQAVSRHLVSDAPLGVFLSGGIDSSLITILAAKLGGAKLRTLSVNFAEAEFDESRYQARVLQQVSTEHHSYLVSERHFMDDLDKIFLAMDQPTVDGVNTYFVAKCAHEDGLKVALSGLGGDELFGGYPSFYRIGRLQLLSKLGACLQLASALCPRPAARLSFLGTNGLMGLYLCLRGLFDLNCVAKLTQRSTQQLRQLVSSISYPAEWNELKGGNLASCLETNLYMTNQLLRDSDFMSMFNSLEIRVPFLDKELVKLVFGLPQSVKFNNAQAKAFLTEAFKDELPTEIYKRRKQGFSFPLSLWLNNRKTEILERVGLKLSELPTGLGKSIKAGTLSWYQFWALLVMQKFSQRQLGTASSA